jgi:hypothetical protein
VFGNIDGAGMPPSAALSPGIPSSTGESKAPPAHSGCRAPNQSHAGSAFAGTVAPITAAPAIAAAAAVLVSLRRALVAIDRVI